MMKISYNVTGAQRKSLVGAISEELNAPAKYLGAPTFAYEAGSCRIDKAGTVTGEDRRDLVANLLEIHGFVPVSEEYDEPDEKPCGEADRLTVEVPLDGFNPGAVGNLTKMVAAKEALIKAALGTEDIPIQETAGTLRFPWFTLDDPSHAAYYVQFVQALCKAAKEKKRVTAKDRDVDNPKYAMRCWLLSLGFIGDEYKQARKVLLKNLNGSGSYKSKVR